MFIVHAGSGRVPVPGEAASPLAAEVMHQSLGGPDTHIFMLSESNQQYSFGGQDKEEESVD
jgi:hypothetical protein